MCASAPAVADRAPPTPASSGRALPPALRWIGAPLLGFVAAFSLHLWPEWSRNPDLSHGFFAPVVCALLLWEARRHGTPRWLPARPILGWLVGAALGAAFLLFALAGLLAASVAWSHAVVNFVLAAALVAALGAGLLVLADERVRLVPCNWPALTAVALWLLAAPLPTGTYARLTLALQTHVTSGVLTMLHFLGVPARQFGNIIELASTSVGVEEACSGIRSLVSCVYAGAFFAGWLVRRPGARLTLLVAAPLLAIAMNFARSLALTLMANAGLKIAGFWHDATGFAILGLTTALLAGLAAWLSPRAPARQAATPLPPTSRPVLARCHRFAGGVAAITALGLVFAVYGRPSPPPLGPKVDLLRLLPAQADGWQASTPRDLYQFAGVLGTTDFAERTYRREVRGEPWQLTVYLAHWAPGQASVSLVASHTPDACWPGAGWVAQPNRQPRVALAAGDHALPAAEHRLFRNGTRPQHVWFWHLYNGRPIDYRDPYSVPALLENALRYGFRRESAQVFIRVSSNRSWEELSSDPLLATLAANLAHLGLTP